MPKILGPNGEAIEQPRTLPQEDVLNIVARVQNLEACLVMMMTIVQRDMLLANQAETDMVMEAFFRAQTARGASHLSREPTDDNPAIFI